MKTRLTLFIAVTLLIYSCELNEKKTTSIDNHVLSVEPDTPLGKNKELIDSLLIQSINYGSKKAYNEISSYYYLEGMGVDFFYYSLIMANKYNNAEACYDVYIILLGRENGYLIDGVEMHNDDENTKKMGIYYLLKSFELGVKEAEGDVKKIFGTNIPKSFEYLQ